MAEGGQRTPSHVAGIKCGICHWLAPYVDMELRVPDKGKRGGESPRQDRAVWMLVVYSALCEDGNIEYPFLEAPHAQCCARLTGRILRVE